MALSLWDPGSNKDQDRSSEVGREVSIRQVDRERDSR